MTTIEITIVILLLLMGVPDLCRKLGRPALAYAVFILFGLVLEIGRASCRERVST